MCKLTKSQLAWEILELIDIQELVEYLGLDIEMETYDDADKFVRGLGKKTYYEICETLISAFEMMLAKQKKKRRSRSLHPRSPVSYLISL